MPWLRPKKQRIRELMIERAWSQLKLSEEADVNIGTVENCVGPNERMCTQTTGDRIARALEAPIRELFSEVVRRTAPKTSAKPLESGARVCRSNLPTTLQHYLVGRQSELRQLNDAWEDPRVNLINVVGIGGQGKTALVKRWMDEAAPTYRGAEKVFAWSFAGQGQDQPESAADELVGAAWKCFCGSMAMPKDWRRRAEQLADEICAGYHLLVIDGLEVLQGPPGPDLGRLPPEEPLLILLQRIAAAHPGLCIVTSRAPLVDLASSRDTTAPQIDLGPLPERAGADLLRKLGVQASNTDLTEAVARLWGHPLSLNLLGHYMANMAEDGEIRIWNCARFSEADLRQGGPSKRIIAEYDAWLGEDVKRSILRLLSLFDSGVDLELLDAFRQAPAIGALTRAVSGLPHTDWMTALTELRLAGLLTMRSDGQGRDLTLHPIVRNYFRGAVDQADPEEKRNAHALVYRTLLARAPVEPIAYRDLLPLYRIMRHGIQAGLHEEVFEQVVWARLLQGYPALALQKYNAGQLDLIAIRSYFSGSPLDPDSLAIRVDDPARRGRLYWWAGLVLRLHGRLDEAIPFFEHAKSAFDEAEDQTSVPMALAYQSSCLLQSGKVEAALERSVQATAYLEASLCDLGQWVLHSGYVRGTVSKIMQRVGYLTGADLPLHRRMGLFDHGAVLHVAGHLERAREAFEQGLKSPLPPGYRAWDLFAVLDGYFCEFLIERGERGQVRAYLRKQWPKPTRSALADAIVRTLLGRLDIPDLTRKTHLLARANDLEKTAEQLDYRTLPHYIRGLLELSARARLLHHPDLAKDLLDRARSAYGAAHLTLFQLDCLLEDAWQARERGDDYQAVACATEVQAMIERDGYHLKEAELNRLLEVLETQAA